MGKHYGYFDHECDLPVPIDKYCGLELPPYLPRYKRWFFSLKKSLIVDENSARTKKIFRSYASIMHEKRRHAEGPFLNVIHPFSRFAIYKERIVCILWIITFLIQPISWSFLLVCKNEDVLLYVRIVLDIFCLLNVLLTCFTGCFVPLTKEIVLNPKTIIRKKALTFLIPETLSSIPYKYLLILFSTADAGKSRLFGLEAIRVLRFMRLFDMIRYLRNIFEDLKMPESISTIVTVFLKAVLLIHWSTCLLYFFSIFYYTMEELPDDSWLRQKMKHETSDFCSGSSQEFLNLLFIILIQTTCHFFGASEGYGDVTLTIEKFMCSSVLILGFIFCNFAIAKVLQLFGSVNISESKYEELLYQVSEYIRSKNLSEDLKTRLNIYYEYKFQKRFFKEEEILSTLSEHLRCEVFLHTCRNILETVPLLQGMSKATIGSIIGYLKKEIFLPNDVVLKYGEPMTKMCWISHGTLAVYYGEEMTEITHFEDGDHFCDYSIVQKDKPANLSLVALEITEIFTLSRRDITHCTAFMKEMTERVTRTESTKTQIYETLSQIMSSGKNQNRFVEDLRKGKILEKDKLRRKRPVILFKSNQFFKTN